MYDIQLQRQKMLASLITKRNEVFAKGIALCELHDLMAFPTLVSYVEHKLITVCRLRYPNPAIAVKLAVQYIKLEELVKRLKAGTDPRQILFEIVAND